MIRHIVIWGFREGTEVQRDEFLQKLGQLYGVIPQIRHMEIHHSANKPQDACLIADFDDLEALESYRTDPRHVAVAALCKPIREDRRAIDFCMPDESPDDIRIIAAECESADRDGERIPLG